jgi:hypothetical protein
MTFRLPIVFTVLLIGASCSRVVVREPKAADLAGAYTLTSASEAFLQKEKKYGAIPQSQILIDSGGGLRWQNLPDCLFSPFGEASGGFESFTGSWTMKRYFYTFVIEPKMKKKGGPSGVTSVGPSMYVLKKSSLVLELMIGDPDSGVSIYYEKKKE